MARFDLHRMAGSYFVDCQADVLRQLSTRTVVPLMSPAQVPQDLGRLHPLLKLGSETYLFAAHLLTAVPARELGPPLSSLAAQEYTIMAALDMLLTGI